jgi:hypothetical protein
LPTEHNHLGSSNPIGWSVTTIGELTDTVFLIGITGWESKQQLGHSYLLNFTKVFTRTQHYSHLH